MNYKYIVIFSFVVISLVVVFFAFFTSKFNASNFFKKPETKVITNNVGNSEYLKGMFLEYDPQTQQINLQGDTTNHTIHLIPETVYQLVTVNKNNALEAETKMTSQEAFFKTVKQYDILDVSCNLIEIKCLDQNCTNINKKCQAQTITRVAL